MNLEKRGSRVAIASVIGLSFIGVIVYFSTPLQILSIVICSVLVAFKARTELMKANKQSQQTKGEQK